MLHTTKETGNLSNLQGTNNKIFELLKWSNSKTSSRQMRKLIHRGFAEKNCFETNKQTKN
jgi:hypothetical protein